MYNKQINDKPCAYITKNKQRIKQFGQNVYLKDGSEFEIELYNPSRETVLSKIKINGEFINGGGIILRPGERVFLERYIDVPHKFKYETYDVDLSNKTMNAIAKNGDIEVLFYEEQESTSYSLTYGLNNTYGTYTPLNINSGTYTPPNINGPGLYSANSIGSTIGFKTSLVGSLNLNSIETGRIEKGSSSNQELKSVNKYFNSWSVSTSVWKILPESQKPVEKKDLVEKCPKCSTKVKKSSWKFCPECGSQLKRTKTEINYIESSYVEHNGKRYMMQNYRVELDKFFESHKNKLIYLKTSSIGNEVIQAVVID